MSEVQPFRMITIIVEPGQDITIGHDGFAFWELYAALARACEKIEEEYIIQEQEKYESNLPTGVSDDDDEENEDGSFE